MKKVAVIDNYDSFTYNLVHYLKDLQCQVSVYRNDEFELCELQQYDNIVLSPGPGIPEQAGLLKEVIRVYAPTKRILGICLGQQAIAEVFGGSLNNLNDVYHGVAHDISITVRDEPLFEGLPAQISVGRYHSWTVEKNLPDYLEATSVDSNGEIMSLRHRTYDVRGLQFHPESVLTPNGMQILSNWINYNY